MALECALRETSAKYPEKNHYKSIDKNFIAMDHQARGNVLRGLRNCDGDQTGDRLVPMTAANGKLLLGLGPPGARRPEPCTRDPP
jgi:hypothetical protein